MSDHPTSVSSTITVVACLVALFALCVVLSFTLPLLPGHIDPDPKILGHLNAQMLAITLAIYFAVLLLSLGLIWLIRKFLGAGLTLYMWTLPLIVAPAAAWVYFVLAESAHMSYRNLWELPLLGLAAGVIVGIFGRVLHNRLSGILAASTGSLIAVLVWALTPRL